jgi:UPF0716 protein FxsA
MRFLLLMFIAVPIAEMWLLIEIGSRLGGLATIALVFLTAAIGLAMLRNQGMSTLMRVNEQMEQGRLPAEEILGGVLLAIGGALLLTPGFITDALGFACLLPASRKLILVTLLRQGVVMASYGGGATFDHSGTEYRQQASPTAGDSVLGTAKKRHSEQQKPVDVIEGDFRRDE